MATAATALARATANAPSRVLHHSWIRLGEEQLHLSLQAEGVVLSIPTAGIERLDLGTLRGEWQLHHGDREGEGGWHLRGRDLLLQGPLLTLQGDLRLKQPPQQPLHIDTQARFELPQAIAITELLPQRLLPPQTAVWLQQAFTAGRMSGGRLLMFGTLEELLQLAPSSVIDVRARAENLSIVFNSHWPALEAIRGQLRFYNQSMDIFATEAKMAAATLRQTRVQIADMRRAQLSAEGELSLPLPQLLPLLAQTPLQQRAHQVGAQIAPQAGRAEVKLTLQIPLNRPLTFEDQELTVAGKMVLQQGRMTAFDRLTATDLSGELNFDKQGFNSGTLLGSFDSQPLRLALERERESQTLTLAAVGSLSDQGWQSLLSLPSRAVTGGSSWQLRLQLPQQGAIRVEFESQLEPLALNLPKPLTKAIGEPLRLQFWGQLEPEQQRFQLQLGERVGVNIQRQAETLQQLRLHLGPTEAPLPQQGGSGIVVTGGGRSGAKRVAAATAVR